MEKSSAIDTAPLAASGPEARSFVDFAELVKARLTLLVLMTTAVGFYLGAGAVEPLALFHVVFGTAMAAAGAAALNQWWERQYDSLMIRTRSRPIPAGRMIPRDAIIVGMVLGVSGVVYLWLACNWLSSALAAATIVIYLFGYTPLKRISAANTLVGAIPGAIPPMIGWVAGSGTLDPGAWTLFAILFAWQMPHFFAIAWLYRDDYNRAGFRMLSSRDLKGLRSGRQSFFFSVALLFASLTPALLGITAPASLPIAAALSVAFLVLAVHFYRKRSMAAARLLFVGSIIYLPVLLALLVVTRA